MNRRRFLGFLAGGAAAAVAVRTFPFRVYSFPSEVKGFTLADLNWIAWDSERHSWYLHPDQAKALEDLLPRAVPLHGRMPMFSLTGCISELGRGSGSVWQRASTYSELDRYLAAGYELPPGYRYDKNKRSLSCSIRGQLDQIMQAEGVAIPDPIASPLENFTLPSVREQWRRLLKGA